MSYQDNQTKWHRGKNLWLPYRAGAEVDPFYSDVLVLWNGEALLDEGPLANTITAVAPAAITATDPRFGALGPEIPIAPSGTTSDRGFLVSTGGSTGPFNIGTSDWCIEIWCKLTTYQNATTVYYFITSGGSRNGIGVSTTGDVSAYYRTNLQTTSKLFVSTIALNTWTFFVQQRRGAFFETSQDGVLIDQTAVVAGGLCNFGTDSNLYIGRENAATVRPWKPFLGPFRFTKAARYDTYPFTPPTANFPITGP